jgi:hypothetical protein
MAEGKMDKIAAAVENNMAVFDAAGGVKDVGLKIKRHTTVDEHGYSHGSLGIGDVGGIAEHDNSLAIGDFDSTSVSGDNAVAVGINSSAAESGVALGEEAWTDGADSIAIGYAAGVEDAKSVAVGESAGIVGNSSGGTAIGNCANVDTSPGGVALGKNASVYNAANAVQLGQGTNERPGTLQFRSFPLMDAQGRIAKEAIASRIFYGNAAQNTFNIDGRCYPNVYVVRSSSQNSPHSNVFDYSSMTGDESDHFLVSYWGAPKDLDLSFHSAGEEGEDWRTIKNTDITGPAIDWTSATTHSILFLVLITDVNVPPEVFVLAKWESSH